MAILLAVVTVALGVLYFAVVPRLESQLVEEKQAELRSGAQALAIQLEIGSTLGLSEQLALAAAQANARVVILSRLGAGGFGIFADSSPVVSEEIARDPVVRAAAATGGIVTGRVEREGRDLAEAAVPFPVNDDYVLLLSARLGDTLASVDLLRRSFLVAGAIAFAVSGLAGTMAALRLTRRIQRLEAGAVRIAGGDFDAIVRDDSRDELGELARTFDRMRDRLSHVDRARREFIANASHELRTPLFALGGFLELLADDDVDERDRRDFLDTARGQVERLTGLATDLLDLSRLDADQVGFELEPVELGEAAETLAAELGPLAESTGHRLGVTSAGNAYVLADGERVLQIGRSLVENALRHTPAGTAVEIHTTVWLDRGVLSVRDDGPGIRPDDQEHVFERFFRGAGGAAAGSGIGLSIARELAHRMGGTIELRSRPGETTFTLTLPGVPSPAPFPRENVVV